MKKIDLKVIASEEPKKHPKCLGYECGNPLDGYDFDCEYQTILTCDECKYGGHGGRKDPEAKCNQL